MRPTIKGKVKKRIARLLRARRHPRFASTVLPIKRNIVIKKSVRILWFWVPVLLWMVMIFSFSSIKGEYIPSIDVPGIDKLFHFVEYFILGALLVRAFSNSSATPKHVYILIISILIASIYGATDEFHQRFIPERSCDIFDLLFDIIGSTLGAGLYSYRERISRAVDKTV